MIECTSCGAQGEANFSTNYFGELVCELCGTQSFLQSRNETQDMEDTNMDVTKASTMKRASTRKTKKRNSNAATDIDDNVRDDSGRNGTMRRGIGKRMKRRGDNATLLDCVRATQTILNYQARALAAVASCPVEYVSVVEQLWFEFLDAWDRKSARPLLRCFTEFFVPRDAADRAMDPAVTQQLLEQWDAARAAEAEAAEAKRVAAEAAAVTADGDDASTESDDAINDASTSNPNTEPSMRIASGRKRKPQRRDAPPHKRPATPAAATTANRRAKQMRHASAAFESFSLLDLLGILVLAARVLNLGVLPSDVAYWVRTGDLPFHNLLSVCSPALQAAVFDVSLFFESTIAGHRVTASRVAYHAHYLAHHLELQLPPLNVSLAAYTLCSNLGLPRQVFQHFQWLVAHLNVKGAAVPEPPLLLMQTLIQQQQQKRRKSSDKQIHDCNLQNDYQGVKELFESSVGIAAHIAVAIKMTANWHEWIYERPLLTTTTTTATTTMRLADVQQLSRRSLDAFVDFCEDALVGPDRANVPSSFEAHVYDLRGKYSDVSQRAAGGNVHNVNSNQLMRHALRAYPAQYVAGVCAERDDEIETRIAALKQQAGVSDGAANGVDGDDDDDVFFYPFYATGSKFRVLHAAYEHVLALLSEYIDAPMATVLSVTERLDRETTCAQAIKAWEAKNNMSAEEAPVIKLYCQMPPIAKLDNSLNTLKNCEHLALSTNCIDRLIPLSGMKKLRILSLGRNQIKKIEKLDDVSDTLEEVWLSYNVIATLDGLAGLTNLTTLYVSNNLIKSWDELDKIANLPKLRDVLFVGNPIYENLSKEEQRLNVLKRIPKVAKIDGDMVKQAERDTAMGQ